MKTRNRIAAAALVVAAGLAGYSIGAHRSSSPIGVADSGAEQRVEQTGWVVDPIPEHPVSSLAGALAQPTGFARVQALYLLAGNRDVDDIEALIVEATALDAVRDRTIAMQVLYARLATLNPEGAVRHLGNLGTDIEADLLRVIYTTWAHEDLDTAIASLRELHGWRLALAGDAIVDTRHGEDLDSLARLVARMPAGYPRGGAVVRAIAASATGDPYGAIDAALQLPLMGDRLKALEQLAGTWTETNPAAAFEYAAAMQDPSLRDVFLSAVMERWVALAPEAAVAALSGMRRSQARSRELATALKRIAWHDVDAAFLLAATIEQEHIAEILSEVARTDPERVLSMTETQTLSQLSRPVHTVVASVVKNDPVAAARWAEQMAPGPVRDEAVRWVGLKWALRDPVAALAWAETLQGEEKRNTASTALSMLDADTALDYLVRNPTPDAIGVRQKIATDLAARSPGEGKAWIRGFEGKPEYAELQAAMVRGWARRDPRAAIDYAADIADDNARANAIDGAVRSWLQYEPAEATAWVQQLPDNEAVLFVMPVLEAMQQTDPDAATELARELLEDPDTTPALRGWLQALF